MEKVYRMEYRMGRDSHETRKNAFGCRGPYSLPVWSVCLWVYLPEIIMVNSVCGWQTRHWPLPRVIIMSFQGGFTSTTLCIWLARTIRVGGHRVCLLF